MKRYMVNTLHFHMNSLLGAPERVLTRNLDSADGQKTHVNNKSGIMNFDTFSNITVRTLDSLERTKQTEMRTDFEPLIEVYGVEGSLKVVVSLPGIREGEVNLNVVEKRLITEVRKGFQTYRKEVPCTIGAGQTNIRKKDSKQFGTRDRIQWNKITGRWINARA